MSDLLKQIKHLRKLFWQRILPVFLVLNFSFIGFQVPAYAATSSADPHTDFEKLERMIDTAYGVASGYAEKEIKELYWNIERENRIFAEEYFSVKKYRGRGGKMVGNDFPAKFNERVSIDESKMQQDVLDIYAKAIELYLASMKSSCESYPDACKVLNEAISKATKSNDIFSKSVDTPDLSESSINPLAYSPDVVGTGLILAAYNVGTVEKVSELIKPTLRSLLGGVKELGLRAGSFGGGELTITFIGGGAMEAAFASALTLGAPAIAFVGTAIVVEEVSRSFWQLSDIEPVARFKKDYVLDFNRATEIKRDKLLIGESGINTILRIFGNDIIGATL